MYEAHSCTSTADTVCDACTNAHHGRPHARLHDYVRKCRDAPRHQPHEMLADAALAKIVYRNRHRDDADADADDDDDDDDAVDDEGRVRSLHIVTEELLPGQSFADDQGQGSSSLISIFILLIDLFIFCVVLSFYYMFFFLWFVSVAVGSCWLLLQPLLSLLSLLSCIGRCKCLAHHFAPVTPHI